MITLPDRRAQEAVLEGLRSENPAALTDYLFRLGNREISGRVESLSYGREGDSMARALDAELSGSLNPSSRRLPVAVDVRMDSIPVRRFTGRAHRPKNVGFRSRLLANTAGWWASEPCAVRLVRERRFSGYTPKRAAEEMLLRLPYQGRISVEETARASLEFVRAETEAFLETDPVDTVLAAISEESRLLFRDTRLDGCRGAIPLPAPFAGDVTWTFRVGRDCDPEAFTSDGEPKEYRDVLAYRVLGSGQIECLAHAEIPGAAEAGIPEGATYLIPIETSEAGPEAYAEAREKANDVATALIHGEHPWTLSLPFIHILLEEGDVVEILEPAEDEDDLILRRWLARVDLIAEDPEEIGQELSGAATYTETRTPKATLSRIVVPSASVVRPSYGGDHLGRPYFSTELSWVSLDSETGELVIDVARAAEEGVEIKRDPETQEVFVSR